MTSPSVAPARWASSDAVPDVAGTVAAMGSALLIAFLGLILGAIGLALPLAVSLAGRGITVRAEDLALARSLTPYAGLLMAIGGAHAIVAIVGLVGSGRARALVAVVSAGVALILVLAAVAAGMGIVGMPGHDPVESRVSGVLVLAFTAAAYGVAALLAARGAARRA